VSKLTTGASKVHRLPLTCQNQSKPTST